MANKSFPVQNSKTKILHQWLTAEALMHILRLLEAVVRILQIDANAFAFKRQPIRWRLQTHSEARFHIALILGILVQTHSKVNLRFAFLPRNIV